MPRFTPLPQPTGRELAANMLLDKIIEASQDAHRNNELLTYDNQELKDWCKEFVEDVISELGTLRPR